MKKILTLALLASVGLSINACSTTSQTTNNQQGSDAVSKIYSSEASKTYDSSSIYARNNDKSMAALERDYKKKPDDVNRAAEYAAGLREEGALDIAQTILEPFAKEKNASSLALSEYAAIMLADGRNEAAENYAQKAILADPNNFQAFHRLGISLDAQSKYEPAERAYRQGLEIWQGNPTSIMNNLALNLASQKHLNEAVEILAKAKEISPDRIEIERNLRIVLALQQAEGAPAPKPVRKPEIKAKS